MVYPSSITTRFSGKTPNMCVIHRLTSVYFGAETLISTCELAQDILMRPNDIKDSHIHFSAIAPVIIQKMNSLTQGLLRARSPL